MRKIRNQQLPLAEAAPDHPKAKELAKISEILNCNSSIYELALQDLGVTGSSVGAKGMTAEQVIRAAIIKQMGQYSYRELEFHLADSRAYGLFCKIGFRKCRLKAISISHPERSILGYRNLHLVYVSKNPDDRK